MKQYLFLSLFMAFVVSSWAIAGDASFSVQLTGGSRKSIAAFAQGSQYTSGQDATDILALLGNTTTAINVYGIAPFGKLSRLTTDDLQGTFIGITTNGNTNYQLNFGLVQGDTLYVYDHVTDSLILVSSSSQYIFTAAATQTIDNRFEIRIPVVDAVCFRYQHLQVTGEKGSNVKILDDKGRLFDTFVLTSTSQDFDLSVYPAGHYRVVYAADTLLINVGQSGTMK